MFLKLPWRHRCIQTLNSPIMSPSLHCKNHSPISPKHFHCILRLIRLTKSENKNTTISPCPTMFVLIILAMASSHTLSNEVTLGKLQLPQHRLLPFHYGNIPQVQKRPSLAFPTSQQTYILKYSMVAKNRNWNARYRKELWH